MGFNPSSLVTCGVPQSSPSSPPPHTALSRDCQLKTSDGGDRGPAAESDWTGPSLLLARSGSRRLLRLLWSHPTSPCPINHFLCDWSFFDRGNQEIPLYLQLISKPASPLNIKRWLWDDPRKGWTAWWAESDVIYLCARRVGRDPRRGAITQRETDLHIQIRLCHNI